MSSFSLTLIRFAHPGHDHSSAFSLVELAGLAAGLIIIATLLAVRFFRKDFKKKIRRNAETLFKLLDIVVAKRKIIIGSAAIVLAAAIGLAISQSFGVDVLSPKGTIARQERDLIIFTTALGMLIIIPVFIMTFLFAYKYREGNTKAKYTPEWDGNFKLEAIWWLIPLIIITILAVITWKTSHALDPFRPLESDKKPVTVQVVALDWKWLFLYPDHGVASMNYVRFPEDTPVNFKITSDAPMNSFWIPELGGQIYAMSGMSTKLHLMADNPGKYDGSSANLSGEGFAGMRFTAESTSESDFDKWVEENRNAQPLDKNKYAEIAKPSKNEPPAVYSLADTGLYESIIMKYMEPGQKTENHDNGEHH